MRDPKWTIGPPLLTLALMLSACGGTTPSPTAARYATPQASGQGYPTAIAVAPTSAPAATAAPAPEAPAPEVPSGDASSASAPTPALYNPAAPTPAPAREIMPQQQQQGTPLRAGEIDDNANFDAYSAYMSGFGQRVDGNSSGVRFLDVSDRLILTVVDSAQLPVMDARVTVFDGQRQLFVGRTSAGGRTILFPRALGAGEQGARLRVVVEKDAARSESDVRRGEIYPAPIGLDIGQQRGRQRLDVLFLLDATGSMSDEIGRIQQTIVSIADRISALDQRPELRFALVNYRDRGDEYVTQVTDFTPDVAAFQRRLLEVRADGGGDNPESLNEGLHQAVQGVNWADDALRLVVLVADAPPHMDYQGDYDYVQEARVAAAKGVKIFPIAASNSDDRAEYVFRQLAQQTLGSFIFLTYQPGESGGAPGDTTQMNVDPASFTVERLDDMVVNIVRRELAAQRQVS